MKPKNIYNFLIGLQPKNNRGTYNSDVKLLSADDLRLPFVGREDAMDEIAKYFKERITARDAKIDDRMKYPIPACAWIPGLGKTGLLHQGKEILHRSGVTGKQIYIIVPYYNGHSLQWIDRELSIECSFAWRLLFMVFLKWNGPEFADFCALKMLPINCEKLTLSIALQTVRVGIIDKNCMDEMLNIFVGIDEFQKIAKEEDEQRKKLTELCQKLHDNSFKSNITVFPLFAGTDWGLICEAGNSSSLPVKRVPMAPLDSEQATLLFEAALGGEDILFNSALASQHLLTVGSLPRALLSYCRGIREAMSSHGATVPTAHYLINAYNVVVTESQMVWNSPSMLAKLVALCFAMEDVSNNTTITYFDEETKERTASVIKLSNSGLCLTTEIDGLVGQYVDVPYMVIHLFAKCADRDMKTLAEKHLLRTVQWMVENVDQVMYTKHAWQSFEDFSAAFTACRINSWLVLGHETVSINDLWRGGVSSVSPEVRVKLLPVSVVRATEQLSGNTGNTVTELSNTGHVIQWRGSEAKSPQCGYLVRNGDSGNAVDNWSSLPLEKTRLDQDNVTCLEQTELETTATISRVQVTELSSAMKSIFENTDAHKKTMVVSCLRNPLPRLGPNVAADLPLNTVVVVRDHLHTHFGMFHRHPAVSLHIDVNTCSKQRLATMDLSMERGGGGREEAIKLIVDRREKKKFLSVNDILEFFKAKGISCGAVQQSRLICRAGGRKGTTWSVGLTPDGTRKYSTLHGSLSGRLPPSRTSFVSGGVLIVKALLKLRW